MLRTTTTRQSASISVQDLQLKHCVSERAGQGLSHKGGRAGVCTDHDVLERGMGVVELEPKHRPVSHHPVMINR
eukprot:122611-Rhodomonas_salina.3